VKLTHTSFNGLIITNVQIFTTQRTISFASQTLKTEVVAIICYSASSKLKISGPKKF